MIDGFATATIVASSRIMKNPTSSAHNAFHGLSVRGLNKRSTDDVEAPARLAWGLGELLGPRGPHPELRRPEDRGCRARGIGMAGQRDRRSVRNDQPHRGEDGPDRNQE